MATARAKLKSFTGNGQILGRSLPHLAAELDGIANDGNVAYLLGEFGCDSWAPLYVAELHERCQEHKLTFLATATLPELFEELLPEPTRSLLCSEVDPTQREALRDLAINQSFRRDIFVKGSLPLRKYQREQALAQLQIIKAMEGFASSNPFTTSVGVLTLDGDLLSAIESALTEGPCTVGDLCMTLGQPLEDLLITLALLIHQGNIELHSCAPNVAARSTGLDVNRRLRDLMQDGHDYGFLVAPLINAAVGFSPLGALVLETIEQGLDDETAVALVQMGLEAIGGHLRDGIGLPLNDALQQVDALRAYLAEFRSIQVPLLRRLGAISEDD